MFNKLRFTALAAVFFLASTFMAQTARVQVIHNAADPAAASVDIYLMEGSNELLKLDDFAFRAATPFVDAPAGVDLSVIIAAPTSTDNANGGVLQLFLLVN